MDEDGTLSIGPLYGVARLVDGGDIGDLYNYAPAGDFDSTPTSVFVEVAEHGPLVGAVVVTRTYRWATVAMRVSLHAGERFCRLELSFDNTRPDHRVRLHVPLPRRAEHSYAEGQFAVVKRGLASEGGHGEVPLPTFPAYGFVAAGGVALLLDQVSEYEVVGDGRELALTLLRATGWISRADHPLRAEPAGPVIPTPQAQCLGRVTTRLAVYPYEGGWEEGGVAGAAEAYRCPFVAVNGLGGPAAETTEGLSITGHGVRMSSLRRRGEWLELRVVALTDSPATATIGPVTAARRADLRGRPGDDVPVADGTLTLPLRPWEIATVQLLQHCSSIQ